MMKRACDIVLAAVGLVALAPLLGVIAALVRLDSHGPVFYRPVRIGRDGVPFRMWKFRTMVAGAASLGPRVTAARDLRVTRVGGVLRWFKLDELPNLINVLLGPMSLVGPRPEDPHFVALYTPEQRAVLSVRPGIVGPSQILGRHEEARYPRGADAERFYVEEILPAKLATDLDYVRTATLAGDLRLIARGVSATVAGALHGARARVLSRRAAILLADTVLGLVTYHLAYGLKFDWEWDAEDLPYLAVASTLILLVRPAVFVYFGLSHGLMRYVGAHEFWTIVKAVTVGSAMVAAGTFMVGFQSHSRLVFLIDGSLLVAALFGMRVAASHLRDRWRPKILTPPKRVLIVGADESADHLATALGSRGVAAYRAIGFLDDDPVKQGAVIRGIRVLGLVSDLRLVITLQRPDMIVILFPHVPSATIRDVIGTCRALGLEYRLVPTLERVLDGGTLPDLGPLRTSLPDAEGTGPGPEAVAAGRADATPPLPERGRLERIERDVSELRRVATAGDAERLDTLLAPRSAVADLDRVAAVFRGRTVLVTGAGGSIGGEVSRQILACRPATLVLLDRYENGLHAVDLDVRRAARGVGIEPVVADVGDSTRVEQVLRRHRPDIVFHAAAHKHVPLSEKNPAEAVKNNLLATLSFARQCGDHRVRRFVFISTDKAANPCSVMGATKRLCEALLPDIANQARCRAVVVRFGNVLGSNGSVVRLFEEQIAAGGPVTVTDPRMTRYFITMAEAARLVIIGSALGEDGATLMLDMGEPVRIVDLARHMIRLAGYRPDDDIKIVFTKARPGERLTEQLVESDERLVPTAHPGIFSVHRTVNPFEGCRDAFPDLARAALAGDDRRVRRLLAGIFPSLHDADGAADHLRTSA
jgi:FlaA1/EpsC-like NDP-sugar epimerase/lipopolysaccharide/colanic/teichoic acid biosynthesis glycosyltransferase